MPTPPHYVPVNEYVYAAALSGCVAGAMGSQPITSVSDETYGDTSDNAVAFAEEFDTLWGVASLDVVQYEAILDSCTSYWRGRIPQSSVPSEYEDICDALITMVNEADAAAIAAGASPPAWPPTGGGGDVLSVTATAPLESSGGDTPDISILAGTVTGQVIVWNETTSEWEIRQLTQDDILPGFSIGSFSVSGGVIEVGATITNPTVAASYSSLPASASVTNTDGHDSPLALTTPFAAGTVTGAFEHSAPATVTFTLTAVSTGGVTKTATATEQWLFRSFAGLGTAGATAATASGSSAVLNDSAGTIASAGLFSSIIGQTFNLSPSGNNVYIVSPTAVSVWRDVNTGFPFAMNAGISFSFTNQNGVVSTYVVYQSTNPLTGTFGVQAVS